MIFFLLEDLHISLGNRSLDLYLPFEAFLSFWFEWKS